MTRMPMIVCLVLAACVAYPTARLAAQDVEAQLEIIKTQLEQLPEPPMPAVSATTLPQGIREFGRGGGISIVPGQAVIITGSVLFSKGPPDGLEVLACLEGGKNHESLVRLNCANGQLVNLAFKAVFDLPDGQPAPQSSGLPGRGTPIDMRIVWVDDPLVDANALVTSPASCLVRDRSCNRAWPQLPFIYTGSQIQVIEQNVPGGGTVKRETFMLDVTKSVVANWDEPDALLASPFPTAGRDDMHEANGALAPPVDTPVWVVFERANLPLTLEMDTLGRLLQEGVVLDDAAIGLLLTEHFDDMELRRAMGVKVDRTTDRQFDVAARERLLRIAVATKVWVIPVFVLAPDTTE